MQEEIRHELIIPNDDIPFKMFLFEGKDGNYSRDEHWHRSVEIMAVLDGEIDVFLNKQRIRLTASEFVLINSNEIHSISAIKPNQTVVLQIPADSFRRYYLDNSFIYFSHSRQDADTDVMQLIRDMYMTYRSRKFGYDFVVQSQFYQLLYQLILKYRSSDIDHQIRIQIQKHGKMSEIIDYVHENYNKKISLDHLGSVFGYSSTYISRLFRKYTGWGFKRYLNHIRLMYAVKDMEETMDTLDVIASRHGFPDRKALNKEFQEQYHMTPRQYWRNRDI